MTTPQTIATRALDAARQLRAKIMAADVLAAACRAVLDGRGSLADLAERLDDYDHVRAERRDATSSNRAAAEGPTT